MLYDNNVVVQTTVFLGKGVFRCPISILSRSDTRFLKKKAFLPENYKV